MRIFITQCVFIILFTVDVNNGGHEGLTLDVKNKPVFKILENQPWWNNQKSESYEFSCPEQCHCLSSEGIIYSIKCTCLVDMPQFPSTVLNLRLDGCGNSTLACGLLHSLDKLENLTLESFTAIDFCKTFFQFQKLSLRFLDLAYNIIPELAGNVFQGLESLTFLSLAQNGLKILNANTFSGLTSLKELIFIEEFNLVISDAALVGLTNVTDFKFLILNFTKDENRFSEHRLRIQAGMHSTFYLLFYFKDLFCFFEFSKSIEFHDRIIVRIFYI